MLTIRLQRVGKKNQAAFRIVLAEKQRSAKKQIVELLGHYNPRSKEFGIRDQTRLDYWVGQHVEISPTVNNLLVTKGLLKGDKVKSWRPKKKEETAPAAAPAKATTPATPASQAAPLEAPKEETKSEEVKPAEPATA